MQTPDRHKPHYGPHTAKVHRSREVTPEKVNPNMDDVFLPKHAPIHIDPKTYEHFQVQTDGTIVHEENIDLGRSVSFADRPAGKTSQDRSPSPQFTGSPSHNAAEIVTPVIGKGAPAPGIQIDPYGNQIPASQHGPGGKKPLVQDFPDDPCP